MKIELIESPRKNKKYRMIFYRKSGEIVKVDFGARGMSDFTIHQDENRKNMFLNRFRGLIEKKKDDYTSPIILSKFILWNKKTIKESVKDYKKHFKLTNY